MKLVNNVLHASSSALYRKIRWLIMAYITRELERKFMKMNGFFKAILVTGA